MTEINEDHRYYKQAKLWSEIADDYQRQVLASITDMLPSDVESILDVGCGDGKITNHLPDHIHVVGCDVSEEALRYVTKEKFVSAIDHIPLADKSFDLVMANDVFEHLSEEDLRRGVLEFQRIASKYILITVPHAEQLETKNTRCAKCGTIYHIHWHQRAFFKDTLIRIFANNGWEPVELRYSGTATLPPYDPTISLKQDLSVFHEWEGAVCPSCGTTEQYTASRQVLDLLPVIHSVRHKEWYKGAAAFDVQDRSELTIMLKAPEYISGYKLPSSDSLHEEQISAHEIRFGNVLQQSKPDFTEGSKWARFRIDTSEEEVQYDSTGIRRANDGVSNIALSLRFSVIPKQGDKLIVSVTGHIPGDRLELHAFDGVTRKSLMLYNQELAIGNQDIEIGLPIEWNADRYGLPIDVIIHGGVEIHSIVYNQNAEVESGVPFIRLEEGYNKISRLDHNGLTTVWGLWATSQGLWPKPAWFVDDSAMHSPTRQLETAQILAEINDMYLGLLDSKEEQLSNAVSKAMVYNDLLNAKEEQRSIAENAYANLQLLTGQLKEEKAKFELQIEQLAPDATLWRKNISRKVKRVLVLSHMFPHPDQLISGPFIHEQVKALREEGLDVRVISCRPYWLNGKNINRIWRAARKYPEYLAAADWTEYQGVPVIYPPYKVGRPLYPFHFHAWSYRRAVMGIIDRVWSDFKFDIVHAHTGYLDGTAGLEVSRKYRVPLLVTEHTGPFTYLTSRPVIKQLTLKAIRNADKVLAVSDALAKEVESYFKENLRVDVMYNGISTTDFYNSENHDSNRKTIRLLYVGYLEYPKNPQNLIKAFAIVKRKVPNVSLSIIGEGSLRGDVVRLIRENGLEDSCELLGPKSREEVARYMREDCDMLVLPSSAETFGVVIIEALASGKPVVATRCGGPESIIKHDGLGELCEIDNPEELASAILKVAEKIDSYNGKQIRQYILDNFDGKVIASKLADLYQIINKKNI